MDNLKVGEAGAWNQVVENDICIAAEKGAAPNDPRLP
jgi:hypothetical protein